MRPFELTGTNYTLWDRTYRDPRLGSQAASIVLGLLQGEHLSHHEGRLIPGQKKLILEHAQTLGVALR